MGLRAGGEREVRASEHLWPHTAHAVGRMCYMHVSLGVSQPLTQPGDHRGQQGQEVYPSMSAHHPMTHKMCARAGGGGDWRGPHLQPLLNSVAQTQTKQAHPRPPPAHSRAHGAWGVGSCRHAEQ